MSRPSIAKSVTPLMALLTLSMAPLRTPLSIPNVLPTNFSTKQVGTLITFSIASAIKSLVIPRSALNNFLNKQAILSMMPPVVVLTVSLSLG